MPTIQTENSDLHRLSIGDTLTVRKAPLTGTDDQEATVESLRRNKPINDDGEYQLIATLRDEDGDKHELKRWIKLNS